MAVDLYQELGVDKSSTDTDIKKAYKKLASKLHPDKNPGDKRSESKFKAVNRAYQTLSDPKKRALYDEFGENALHDGFEPNSARAYQQAQQSYGRGGRGGGGNGNVRVEDFFSEGGADLGDLFGDLFSAKSRGRGSARVKGSDVASEITIEFAQALRGTEVKLQLQDRGEPVTVRIPPGATDGDRIRLSGHGQPSPIGGPPGDLVLAIRVRPHALFERRGLDLHLDLPITIGEAYHGAKVKVPTPNGTVTLTVPKRAQSGQTLRLKSKGVHRSANIGDLYVRFLVRYPEQDSKEMDRAVDDMEHFMNVDIRSGLEL